MRVRYAPPLDGAQGEQQTGAEDSQPGFGDRPGERDGEGQRRGDARGPRVPQANVDGAEDRRRDRRGEQEAQRELSTVHR